MKRILILIVFSLFLIASPALGQMPLVVIDPAHGGKDVGVAVSEGVKEKDLTLKISLLIKKELERSGRVKVFLTRETDVDLPVEERIRRIKSQDVKAVVSIHVNRGFGRSARGFEIYFPGFKSGEGEKKKPEAQHIIQSMQKTEYLNKSVLLARHLKKHLLQVFPREDRGLREAPMDMTEGLTVPAVVIELGFVSNGENLKKLTDPKGQEEIASAICRGVLESMVKR